MLVQVSQEGLGRKFALGASTILGRAADADIQVLGALISKKHARIFQHGSGFAVEDLGSKNGVSVNGARITAPQPLRTNDLVAIGEALFLFAPNLEVIPVDDGAHAVIIVDDDETQPGKEAIVAITPAPSPVESFLAGADVSALMSELLAWLEERVPFSSAGLLRTTADGYEPVSVAAAAPTISVPKSLIRATLSQNQLIYVADAMADTSYHSGSSVASGARSLVAAPLRVGNEVTGVLFLCADRPRAYEQKHLQALASLLPSIAMVLGLWERQQALARSMQKLEALARKGPGEIIGESAVWREVRALVAKVSAAPSPVLIQGESGTGKELIARELHAAGKAPHEAFVAINCGAIPEALMESELFGYERGAFTGAAKRTLGKLELAHGGTLFLDEIGDLPLHLQVKLLRALQEKQFYRLGGAQPVRADFRLLAATHRDLKALVQKGQFREDLFYRINVINLTLPPLRERKEDIAALAIHFAADVARDMHRRVTGIAPDALAALRRYPWPGNVRELKNVLERIVVLMDGERITLTDLPPEIIAEHGQDEAPLDATLPRQLEVLEQRLITQALKKARGRKVDAARALGISRPTLDKKIKDYAIDLFPEADK